MMPSTGMPVDVAEVQIPRDPDAAVVFDLEVHALKMAPIDRKFLRALDPKTWNRPGIYVLLGPLGGSKTEAYVGKSGVAYRTPSEAGKAAHKLKHRPRGWTDWKLGGGTGPSLHELREAHLAGGKQ